MHNLAIFKKKAAFSLLSLALLLSACGGNQESSHSTSSSAATNLSGTVTKGPVDGASVYVYRINADGTRSAQPVAGPFLSDSTGQWQGAIPEGVVGPFLLVASGGKYIDETSKQNIEIGKTEELTGVVESGQGKQALAPITPYTHAIALAALQKAKDGVAPSSAVQETIAAAKTGLGFDPTRVIPPNPLSMPNNATVTEKRYAALLGGLTALAEDAKYNGLQQKERRFQLMLALSRDMVDGKLDGKDLRANPIMLREKLLPAIDTAGLNKLRDKALGFAANHSGYQNLALPQFASDKPMYEKARDGIAFQTISKSAYSANILESQALSRHIVVNSVSQWESVWAKYQSSRVPRPALPVIDFEKNYVIGVTTSGNNGCYDIEIKTVKLLGNKLRVEYLRAVPPLEQICAAVMVNPVHFVTVPKLANRVEFKDLTNKANDDADETLSVGDSVYSELPFETLDRSSPSTNLLVRLDRHLWIADSATWQAVWSKHQTIMPTPALPVVDFAKKQVLGVRIDSGSGCAGVEIKEVRAVGTVLTVIYQQRVRKADELCTQSFISPAHFIAVPKGATQVNFKDTTNSSTDGAVTKTLNTATKL